MNLSSVITIIDLLLWIIIAANVAYVLFFALASILPNRRKRKEALGRRTLATEETQESGKRNYSPSSIHHQPSTFLVLFPAYNEDTVILHSVESFLQQDYPKDLYEVVVISDHMSPETNEQLSQLPITLLQPTFDHSSKAKALQFAIAHNETSKLKTQNSNYIVILDADNIVQPDFLTRLNEIVSPEVAIQCHRTAKNADNNIAALDGISEEINNSIFRKGHNRIGMSSALIGSGMCFDYQWFKENVMLLDSAVEDRELEALLMKQGVHIHYAEDIHVLDEKVSNSDTFQRQRLRWMTGQVQAFFNMLPYIPKAIITGNINFIDKTIQQALIPRSILLVLTPLFAFISFIIEFLIPHSCVPSVASVLRPSVSFLIYLWWTLFAVLIAAIIVSIPAPLRTTALFGKVIALPLLVWKMAKNALHIKPNNKDFIHTTHQRIH